MNTRRCLKIAARIGTLLEQEIGLGVDAKRMLTERLYMRDVLLVCDAHRGSELAELAGWFRRSAAEVASDSLPAHRSDGNPANADDDVLPTYDSLRDRPATMPTPAMLVQRRSAPPREPAWFSPARWLSREAA
jgi:hypothetical protein